MTEPRRAMPYSSGSAWGRSRTRNGIVAAVAAAALIIAGVTGAIVVWRAAAPQAGQSATPAQAASPSRTAAPSPTQDPTRLSAEIQLRSCVDRVAVGERLLEEAATGIARWREHTQAQTDANAGLVTPDQRDDIFERTAAAAPEDLRRYDEARTAYNARTDSCAESEGAPEQLAVLIEQCRGRLEAQEDPVRAADAAMADWRTHLAGSELGENQHNPQAQQVWNRAWAEAPKNLADWRIASDGYRVAPSCAS